METSFKTISAKEHSPFLYQWIAMNRLNQDIQYKRQEPSQLLPSSVCEL
jgi:hypothetical protein